MTRRRGGPPLSDDDKALWDDYTRGMKRLMGRPAPERPVTRGPGHPPSGKASLKASTALPAAPRQSRTLPLPPAPAAKAVIEERLVKHVQRGRHDIHATIDLHGLTQAEAKPRLLDFLHRAQARGFRMVLVITGKGRRGGDDNPFVSKPGAGVLQRAVRLWLSEPACRSLVVGIAEAHQRHGGSGALYVQIRRPR